jgi:hypothetical protein
MRGYEILMVIFGRNSRSGSILVTMRGFLLATSIAGFY